MGADALPMYVKESRIGSKPMRTTIDIGDALMRKAMRLTALATKKAVVEAALRLLIQTRSEVGIRRLRGKVKWEGNLDVSRRGRILPARRSKASPLDVKGVKLRASTAELVAIVRKGRERG
jgi:Arc/MetJ family transcription regulator